MRKKLFNFAKTTFTEKTGQDLQHEDRVDKESNLKMANAKKRWLIDYQ
jgi:hypothetical protein